LVRHSALVRDLRIDGGKSVRRDDSMWIVTHSPGASLTVRYEIALKVKSFDSWDAQSLPIAAEEYFHGVGSAFLMTPNSHPGTPAEFEAALRWSLPAGYKAACSWGGTARSVAAKLRPSDLKQSSYLAGKITTTSVEEGGIKLSVAMIDRFGFSIDEFAARAMRIIRAECDFMAEKEFPEFVITVIPVGKPLAEGETRIAGSGLFQGFALFLAPKSPLSDGFEHLFAHELFHQWNGRRLIAANPERLVYWFTEGFTDYFALRILHDSGIWSAPTYAKWLSKHLRDYATNPARNASNEDIDKHYWTQRGTFGEVAYQRGLMLGLRWNHLAKQRGVKDGVDALLRALLARARTGAFEASNDTIRAAGTKALGGWFEAEFDRYVGGAETVEVPPDALLPGLEGRVSEFTERGQKFSALQFRAAGSPQPKR
ncbi:MAG: hypothetical protein HZB38_06785, partial [Planctomycetes bacterium]|nr:hypothetical protein [Planctomycetota bacterium]